MRGCRGEREAQVMVWTKECDEGVTEKAIGRGTKGVAVRG